MQMDDLVEKPAILSECVDFYANYAVLVNNLSFGYNKTETLLNNFCMQIKRGEILALLGPNGCGKTTILKMILGRVKPKNGWIRVFGQTPGHKNSMIPGPAVGYMPQEIGLMANLTIEENIIFFSKLFHLNTEQIEERLKQLTQLYNLCEKSRRIDQLSGGQQRLVSLAVAVVHKPRLIILDEPTVQNKIRGAQGNTVIITTHYVEEAKRASTVAFMKSGAVLRQSNPQNLMNEYQRSTLEAVYVCLWEQKDNQLRHMVSEGVADDDNQQNMTAIVGNTEWEVINSKKTIDFYRVLALVWKFNLRFKKYPYQLFLFIGIPFLALMFLYPAVGYLPHDIPVAVHSEEAEPLLSKQFIDSIDRNLLNVRQYESKESAIDSILKGKTAFAIFFALNFTKHFESRIKDPFGMSGGEEDGSTIKLYTDNSRGMPLINGLQYLVEVLQQFVRSVGTGYNLNLNAITLPLAIERPIYGSHPITSKHTEKFRINYDNLVPGFLVVTLHLASVVSSCIIIVNNRRDSHMNRFLFSGGQPMELIVAHYIQVMTYTSIQVLLLLVFGSNLLDIKQEGSYAEVYLLCILQSLQGLSIGLLIALPLKEELTVMTIVAFAVFPLYYVSGVVWPLEGIPSYFRWFAEWTPLSKPIDSLRSIMLRGWDYTHPKVYTGYVVSIIYTLVTSLLTMTFFQIHQEPFI